MSFNISTDALKTKLSVGLPTATRKIPKISEDTARQYHIDPKKIGTHITVLEDDDDKKIRQVVTAAREQLRMCTAPWTDDGWRMLVVSRRNDLHRRMREHEDEFKSLVHDFTSPERYQLLYDKTKEELNGVFPLVKFPTREQLINDYYWKILEEPIAAVGDVRLNHVSPEEQKKIVEQTQHYYQDKIKGAHQDMMERIEELVRRVCAVNVDGVKEDGKKARLYDSVIENIAEAVDILPALNITEDSKVSAVIARMKKDLASISPKDMKADAKVRGKMVATAKEILADVLSINGVKPESDPLLAPKVVVVTQPAPVPAPAPATVAEDEEGYESKTMCTMMGIDPPRPITRKDVEGWYPNMPMVVDAIMQQLKEAKAKPAPAPAPAPAPVITPAPTPTLTQSSDAVTDITNITL